MPPPRPVPTRSARPAQPDPAGELRGVLEPVVAAAGFELDTLDVRTAGRRHTVRLVVDSDAGVGLDDIARISRDASAALDRNDDLVAGAYTLEVTSPGAERPLTTPRHWRRAHLRLVNVRPSEGAPFQGRVGAAADEAVTVLVDGVLREVRYADVAHAAVEVEFNPPPQKDIALLAPGARPRPGAVGGDGDAEQAAEGPR
jgi:ribosome maturation factor RimP